MSPQVMAALLAAQQSQQASVPLNAQSPSPGPWGTVGGMSDPSINQAPATVANLPMSGAQQLAMRDAGAYDPNSLPGQLQARNAMWDKVSAFNQQQSQQLTNQAQQRNLAAYPIPSPGQQPNLDPVMQSAQQQSGQTPEAWLLNQRLGGNQTLQVNGQTQSWIDPNNPNGVDPHTLFLNPHFQNVMQQAPDKANQVFQALTGQALFDRQPNTTTGDPGQPGFASIFAKQQASDVQNATDELKQKLVSGEATLDPQQGVLFRQLVPDITKPGAMMLGDKYTAPNTFQTLRYTPQVLQNVLGRTAGQFFTLAQKGVSTPPTSPQVANLQTAPTSAGGTLAASDYPSGSVMDTLGNTLTGAVGTIAQALTGQPTYEAPTFAYSPPTGGAPAHMRATLQNNPRFQTLLKTNPVAARKLVLAMQLQNQAIPTTDISNTSEIAGP